MSCCNCSVKLPEEYAVKEITVCITNGDTNDGDEENEEDSNGGKDESGSTQSMSLKDAITSIFGTDWISGTLLRKTSEDLYMCYRCAEALGALYQAYINFVQFSEINSCLFQTISQIKQSYRRSAEKINTDPLLVESSFLEWNGGDDNYEPYHSEFEHDVKPPVKDLSVKITKKYDFFDDDSPISTRLRRSGRNSRTLSSIPSNNTTPTTEHLDDKRKVIKRNKIQNDAETESHISVVLEQDLTSSLSKTEPKKIVKKRKGSGSDSDDSLYTPHKDLWKPKSAEQRRVVRRKIAYQRAACKLCPRTFPFFWMKKFHTLQVHEYVTPMQCQSCDFEYFDAARCEAHVCQKELPNAQSHKRCIFCGDAVLKFNFLSHGREHDRKPSAPPDDIQDEPDETSGSDVDDSEDGLYNPSDEFSKPKRVERRRDKQKEMRHQRVPCNLCPRRFPFVWMVNFHTLQVHENVTPMQCESCDFVYFDVARGESHICHKVAEKSKTHTRCGFCGDAVTKFSYLMHGLKHDRETTGHGLLHCTVPDCNKKFPFKGTLERHIKLYHTEDGVRERKERAQVQCDECGKVFATQKRLTAHTKIHAEIGKYVCSFCGLPFKLRSGLSRHRINVHVGARKFQCPLCKLGFKTSANLRAHFQCKAHRPEEVRDLLTKNIEEFKIKETDDIIIPNRKSDKSRRRWGTNRLLKRLESESFNIADHRAIMSSSSSQNVERNRRRTKNPRKVSKVIAVSTHPTTMDDRKTFSSSFDLDGFGNSLPVGFTAFLPDKSSYPDPNNS